MKQQAMWKEKIMDFFFESEEEQERDPNVFVLKLSGWKWWLAIISLSCVLSMTIFSYTYIFKASRAVENLCAAPLQQIGTFTARGGMFEINTSREPVVVLLEPIQTDSTTHRHLKCTVSGF